MTIKLSIAEGLAELTPAGPLEPPLAASLSGVVPTSSRKIFSTDDGQISTGFWETEPGRSRWEFLERGEIIHVLSGAMTVEEDGGDPVDVRDGDVVVFPIGWRGVWNVTERLRKLYVIYRHTP